LLHHGVDLQCFASQTAKTGMFDAVMKAHMICCS
jgi:hypothetical protein